MCFVAPEQKLFCGNFCYLTLSSVCWNQGLNFAKFLRPGLVSTMFCGSRAERVLRQFFVTWLCRACVRTRGLNFAIIFTPWSCLHCVFNLWHQSRSCFTAIFVTWFCRACVRTMGLISLKFARPGLVYTVFCGSRPEVILLQFLLPDSVEGVLEPGA